MTTPAVRLARARRVLVATIAARALLVSALLGVAALAFLLALDTVVGLSLGLRARLTPLPWLALGGAVVWHLIGPVRDALTAGTEQVALWFERRIPALRYALVTQVGLAPSPTAESLARAVADAPLEAELRAAVKRALTRPAVVLLVAAGLLALVPGGAVGRVIAPAAGDALARVPLGIGAGVDPLGTIVVRVTPPAYTGLAAWAIDDPATVTALTGSRVVIEGRGGAVRAILAADTLRARGDGTRWSLTLALPARATALRLLSPVRERVLLLEAYADSVPGVRLILPERDTVLRIAAGRIPLRADLTDDLGLAGAAFELIISSGGGETFTFRNAAVSSRGFGPGTRSASLAGELVLDTLGLAPGDLVHLRAVGTDRNDVTGPGRGVSETRTLRIARADEYDSVSVEPLPPSEPEKGVLSQRMILLLTQELHGRQPTMSQADVAAESRRIAVDQTKLRKRVGEIVFLRLGEDNAGEHSHFAGDGHDHGEEGPLNPEAILAAAERAGSADPSQNVDHAGDETPVVAINRPLLEAYNHMWRASSELETADPGAAIPWMERAIEALQRARAAERIYLRGRPARIVVDLARVRGSGKDAGTPDPRAPRPAVDPERAGRLARFDAALGLVARAPAAAADSLLLLRLTVPEDERAAALALDAAATALRRGGDVTLPLAAARRALAGEPPRRAPLRRWGH